MSDRVSELKPPRVVAMAKRAQQKKGTGRASWLAPAAAVVIAIMVAFFFQHSTSLPGENLLDGDARLERLKPLRRRIDALVAGDEAKGDAPSRYPASRFKGRGIVTAGGGRSLYSQLYVWLKALREGPYKTDLPVEIFYAGEDELPAEAIAHSEREFANVTFVDATRAAEAKGINLRGYQMKAFAVYLSSFEEVLWLDADNFPLVDAAQLFALRPPQQAALLWPDVCNMISVRPAAWRVLREPPPPGHPSPRSSGRATIWWNACVDGLRPEVETGQLLLHKRLAWPALRLLLYFNAHHELPQYQLPVHVMVLHGRTLAAVMMSAGSTNFATAQAPRARWH